MTSTVNAGRGVVTPQGVILDLEAAGVGYRGLARVVDIAVLFGIGALVFGLISLVGSASATTGLVLQLIAGFLLIFGYPIVGETFFRGRTIGKWATGLRVLTLEAGPIGFREAFIRSIFQIIDVLASFGAVALLTSIASRRSQRLGDLAAGTFVVRDPGSVAHIPAVPFTPPMGTEAIVAQMDVSRLKPDQERVIRSFLLRVHNLSHPARINLGNQMAQNVAQTLGHDPMLFGLPAEPYLVAVMAAHQAREGGLAQLAIE